MQNFSDAEGKVTIVIPNWNGMRWLEPCLVALGKQTLKGFSVIVVDNGSSDGSVAFLRKAFPGVRVIELKSNNGFARAVNIGISIATTPYVALLNTDTEVYSDWLSRLLACIERASPEVAAVSSQMLMMDDPTRIDDAGDELSWYGAATKRGHGEPAVDYDVACEIFSPSAGASLYRRNFLRELGGFDAAFFAYLEDVDLGLRGRLMGYRYLYEPAAKVSHKGYGSGILRATYVELMTRNRLMLFAKNMPAGALLRHAPQLVWGQIYFLIAYARPWSSLKGYGSFIASLPAICRRRQAAMTTMRLVLDAVDALLGPTAPSPSLRSRAGERLAKLLPGRADS